MPFLGESNIRAGAAAQSASAGYVIPSSIQFESASTQYLTRTPSGAGNLKTWTFSVWARLTSFPSVANWHTLLCAFVDANNLAEFSITHNGEIYFEVYESAAKLRMQATGTFFRDPTNFYHFVLAYDTTQATEADRFKFYVNGVQITSFTTATYPAQNYECVSGINSTNVHRMGYGRTGNSQDGVDADVILVDGQALDPTDFGEYNDSGFWVPKAYTGTYGTNGFFLQDATGEDKAGSNDWTPVNTPPTVYDVPTPSTTADVGAFCRLNDVDVAGNTLSNAALKARNTAATRYTTFGTIFVNSGKWYWEVEIVEGDGSLERLAIGVAQNSDPRDGSFDAGDTGYLYYENGNAQTAGDASSSAYGNSYTTSDVIGVLLDMDNGTISFEKNNSSEGQLDNDLSGKTVTPVVQLYGTRSVRVNFGESAFNYAIPAGYKALHTGNLPDVDIVPTDHFYVVTYTGNGTAIGSGGNEISSMSYQPDFVWIKNRDAADQHILTDAVRGVTKYLSSDGTDTEVTDVETLSSFDADGFTIGNDVQVNTNTENYVAWNWKANGAGVTNTDGSITSTVSANPTAGFSIVAYTGGGAAGTIGHGLGVTPSLIMVKDRETVSPDGQNWIVYDPHNGATNFLVLNDNRATAAASTLWNNTAPTSSVFSVGSSSAVSQNTEQFIAYCFANIDGYQKIGSYVGNNSTDGPFIYTGFRPAFLMIKVITTTGSWDTLDAQRSINNPTTNALYTDTTNTEGGLDTALVDFCSTGFKLRSDGTYVNDPQTYIYLAIADVPAKYALAR